MKQYFQELASLMDKMGMDEIILLMKKEKENDVKEMLNDRFPNGSVSYGAFGS